MNTIINREEVWNKIRDAEDRLLLTKEGYVQMDYAKCTYWLIALHRRVEDLLNEFGIDADDPTQEEIRALTDKGWRHTPRNEDEWDWFWPKGEHGSGWRYKDAVKEQQRREQNGN